MNNLVVLTETIIKKIVSDVEAVSVKEYDSSDEDVVQIEVMVASDDLGKVIGRSGKTINSIRTIVQASSSLNDGRRIKINVDSY